LIRAFHNFTKLLFLEVVIVLEVILLDVLTGRLSYSPKRLVFLKRVVVLRGSCS
jgi:hypothetical protein